MELIRLTKVTLTSSGNDNMAKTPSKRKDRTGEMMETVRRRFGNNPPTTANDTVRPTSRTRIKPKRHGFRIQHEIRF
jgi:hypothetical protein